MASINRKTHKEIMQSRVEGLKMEASSKFKSTKSKIRKSKKILWKKKNKNTLRNKMKILRKITPNHFGIFVHGSESMWNQHFNLDMQNDIICKMKNYSSQSVQVNLFKLPNKSIKLYTVKSINVFVSL